MNFSNLKLSDKSLRSVKNYGYESATEVQQNTIPKIIEGKNLIIRSQTGTGKTAAFSIGIMERISLGKTARALVLVPTRELAVQVSKEMNGLSQVHQLKIISVYGGAPISKQISLINKDYDVIVATPGRLIDLLQRGVIDMPSFNTAVLDEADHMLDMGFQREVLNIISRLPHKCQYLLFSATIDERIMKITSRYMPDSEMISIGESATVASITEEKVMTTLSERFSILSNILKTTSGKILVFAKTKRGVMGIKSRLEKDGFTSVGMIQGDMPQSRRLNVLNHFKENHLSILIATNVAARGIHVDNVDLIINYDEAEDKETHLHRVGRTGRMGKEGRVINIICTDSIQKPFKHDNHKSHHGSQQKRFIKKKGKHKSKARRA